MRVEAVVEVPKGSRNKYEMDHRRAPCGSTESSSPPPATRQTTGGPGSSTQAPRRPSSSVLSPKTRVNLLLFGPPASGKGTQADLLSERLGIPQVATGNILRAELTNRSQMGLQAEAFMHRGDLVPDGLMIGIIRERLRRPDCQHGFILDGFPRTVRQAQALEELVSSLGIRFDRVLFLTAPDEELVRRISGRLTCPLCGHSCFFDPERPRPDHCEGDGGLFFVRDDDRPETARNRIAVYMANTLPVLDFYRPRGLVSEIDGRGSVIEVAQRLVAALERPGILTGERQMT